MAEEDKAFLIIQMRSHKRTAILWVFFGLLVTLIIAIFPAFMWYEEFTHYPIIFSPGWWIQNEMGGVILGLILLLIITALPILPVIWTYRKIRVAIIDYRSLKKVLADFESKFLE